MWLNISFQTKEILFGLKGSVFYWQLQLYPLWHQLTTIKSKNSFKNLMQYNKVLTNSKLSETSKQLRFIKMILLLEIFFSFKEVVKCLQMVWLLPQRKPLLMKAQLLDKPSKNSSLLLINASPMQENNLQVQS